MQTKFDKKAKSNQTITEHGYDFYEVLSALQKEIRRGNEYEAVFWAVELESFSNRTLWNRLRIIASEDIGIANSIAVLMVDVLMNNYFEALNWKGDSYRLFLVNAVLFLARSYKSRIVDDLLITVYGDIKDGNLLKVPDYVLDKHTARGKRMGRGVEHFL
jgi:replication-associated recombination protein RarA